MEDHMNTSRLAVTAAFIRGVPNYAADHPATNNYDCAIYHALPHSLLDPLRRKVIPEIFIDTGAVHNVKREALEAHKSQQNWLEDSQKMNSYIQSMENFSSTVGVMSKRFEHAEGWRRHLHVGFSEEGFDPLKELGERYLTNENYKLE
jgi:LmbE family N-acetylglucosaminyl deacetylase